MNAQLVIFQNNEKLGIYELDSDSAVSIGRHPDCDLCFSDIKISANHCIIENKDSYFYAVDQNSTNGTYVNETRIRSRKLYNGDIVKCGDIQIHFKWVESQDESEQGIEAVALDDDSSLDIDARDVENYNRIGNYIILGKIGQGGIGEVYEAEHITSPGNQVAIKILTTTAREKETLVKRFIREARSCMVLDHPRIIKVFEIDSYNNRPYFVMEYIKGQPLDKIVKKSGAISAMNALKIGGHITHALIYAHSHNIIHRDLKPSNILIEDKTLNVKLIDFGLAKMLDQTSLTVTHHLVGTPRYMSPEQMVDSKEVDERIDIYALGATLYHIITGIAPYAEIISNNKSTLLRYMYSTPPLPMNNLVDVPEDVSDLIEKAMSKNKEDRFSNAYEMFKAITAILHKFGCF